MIRGTEGKKDPKWVGVWAYRGMWFCFCGGLGNLFLDQ
ncbi:hypothetical protein L810_8088 [Burkholderia sp. AU4i]|nr:hypothetical protein L810_8088 [Burkholderia sp. AU4i]